MQKFDAVIVGSGLGGLLCANILSKEGFSVCLIEKNPKLGGSLQTFGRKACFFNTGLNYTESLDDGQILNQYFRYFGLMDKLKLRRLDNDGFEVISFKDGAYKFAMGHDHFVETLLGKFPHEKEGLKKYAVRIKNVCQSFPLYTLSEFVPNVYSNDSIGIGASDYIKSVISDPRLQNILAGNSMLYGGVEDKTPLFVHALINSSFIESAWRLVDGSHQMVNILADNIRKNGGTILTNCEAKKFIFETDKLKYVQLSNEESIETKYFISNIHPERTLAMVEQGHIKKAFLTRIKSLENTMGMFTVYVVFKKEMFPYLNYNFYHYNQDNTWVAGNYSVEKWPQNYLLMTTANSKSEKYADGCSIITYMDYKELGKWENTYVEKRGDDYLEFKQKKAEKLIEAVEKQFPGFGSSINTYYTSTPLTWRDYTGTKEGSAYGVLKDFKRPLESFILPRTKVANLFFTGQNINIHGILGVTISSVLTCAELIDIKYIVDKIKRA